MAETHETLHHGLDLPDGAVPLAVVELVEYLDPDTGQRVYGYRHQGASAVSTTLGLIDLMKGRVAKSARFPDDD